MSVSTYGEEPSDKFPPVASSVWWATYFCSSNFCWVKGSATARLFNKCQRRSLYMVHEIMKWCLEKPSFSASEVVCWRQQEQEPSVNKRWWRSHYWPPVMQWFSLVCLLSWATLCDAAGLKMPMWLYSPQSAVNFLIKCLSLSDKSLVRFPGDLSRG